MKSVSCPYAKDLTETEVEIDKVGWQGATDWTSNFLRWAFATSPGETGGVGFFTDACYDDKGRLRPYVKLSLVHKTCIGFSHPLFWKVFNQCKGKKVVGGEELDKLAHFITKETPLTINEDYKHQREIKKLCTRNLFSKPMVTRQFDDVYRTVGESIERSISMSRESVNLSQAIIQLLSRANSVALFGPHGSRAYDPIQELLHETRWDQVAESVEVIGKFVNEAVLFSPKYYAIRVVEGCLNLVKRTGLIDEEQIPKVEYQRHFKLLEEATQWVRTASLKALDSEVTPDIDDKGNPIQGMIELMLNSDIKYTDEQIDGMIRLILVVGQRTTAFTLEAAVRLLILLPEWQEKIYEEIQEKCPDGVITAETLKSLDTLERFMLEVYRLNPAVLIQTRETAEEMKVGLVYKKGTSKLKNVKLLKGDSPVVDVSKIIVIPKGTTTAYIHLFAQRHPDIYKDYDPHEFEPDRFIDDDDLKTKKKSLRTFSGSPSNCCGEWLARDGTIPASIAYLVCNFIIGAKDVEKVQGMKIVGGAIATHDKELGEATLTRR